MPYVEAYSVTGYQSLKGYTQQTVACWWILLRVYSLGNARSARVDLLLSFSLTLTPRVERCTSL